jgi:sodium transport system permease protein
MRLSNVKLILGREIRDQLRDRRTLFMIAVLPLFLYPLLGISFFQLAQFLREHPTRVLVVGGAAIAQRESSPRLFDARRENRFATDLFGAPRSMELLDVTFAPAATQGSAKEQEPAELARHEMERGHYDAVIYFPPDFVDRLEQFRHSLRARQRRDAKSAETAAVPNPVIFYNTAREASQVAQLRLTGLLQTWMSKAGEQNLIDSDVPATAARPFLPQSSDLADQSHRDAAMWSKILPFVLMIWTLTGAFYPAVDLCAGEKERGTLETLLSSPARRSEIVVGKLLTVMLFSIATAVLNLASMGITGALLILNLSHLPKLAQIGMPPASAVLWLALAMIPVSALFSALSVALAAFARSTKEGQYYLMPLIVLSMPLVILPMSPSIKLHLGTALIPLTGLMLLLRELLQGNYQFALLHAAPVAAVTLVACLLAIRWAIDQFNSESVLFRESERFDLGMWLKSLLRDREETPTLSMAVLCGVLLLVIRFFAGLVLPTPTGTREFLNLQVVTMVAFIAAPALFMAVMLTANPRKTLLLARPPVITLPLAVGLAMALHPTVLALHRVLAWLYPIDAGVTEGLSSLLKDANLPQLLLVFAVLPAVCEELAFRGFILSGLRHNGHVWRAILVSSIFFGLAHSILQQSIAAVGVGVVLGYLAVQTGSLWPCVLFHLSHNALTFALSDLAGHPALTWMFEGSGEGLQYRTGVVLAGAVLAVGILYRLHRSRTADERPVAHGQLSVVVAHQPEA